MYVHAMLRFATAATELRKNHFIVANRSHVLVRRTPCTNTTTRGSKANGRCGKGNAFTEAVRVFLLCAHAC